MKIRQCRNAAFAPIFALPAQRRKANDFMRKSPVARRQKTCYAKCVASSLGKSGKFLRDFGPNWQKNIDNLAIRFYFSHELGETVRKMG